MQYSHQQSPNNQTCLILGKNIHRIKCMTAADRRIPVKYNSSQRESPFSRKETTTTCTQGSSSCSQLKINTLCLCTVLFNRDLDNLNNFLGNTPGEVGLSSFPHYKRKGDLPSLSEIFSVTVTSLGSAPSLSHWAMLLPRFYYCVQKFILRQHVCSLLQYSIL